MAQTNHVTYTGLQAPVAFHDAAELEGLAKQIIPSWPTSSNPPAVSAEPFVSLSPVGKDKWLVEFTVEQGRVKTWDRVDALCDVVSEMAWQRLRVSPDLFCLHAAAVAFGERLVVFPNARRAGKSTLAIALAKLGLPLFTDDFLPMEINEQDGRLIGIANGIAPRLRLPAPDEFSDTFKAWVADNPGPENSRYKYLTGLPLATGQTRMPLGAVVVLDRQDVPTSPRLEPAAPSEVLQVMIKQNFSRDQHAGRILKSIEAVTKTAPLFRLIYSSAEEAAAWLASNEDLKGLPEVRIGQQPMDEFARSYQREVPPTDPFDAAAVYRQAPNLIEAELDGAHFLADGSGQAIHKLNLGSLAIWRILSEPADLEEVVEIMSTAFPDADIEQIRIDGTQCLRQFAKARLIEKDQPGMERNGGSV